MAGNYRDATVTSIKKIVKNFDILAEHSQKFENLAENSQKLAFHYSSIYSSSKSRVSIISNYSLDV